MKDFFGILGGMGTMATENFVRTLDRLTEAHSDQNFLNYLVFNHACISDRTAYIFDRTKDNPLSFLKEDIQQLNSLSADFVVITCNTAHYFLPELTAIAKMPILNMPSLAVQACKKRTAGTLKISILATDGIIASGLYQEKISAQSDQAIIPDKELQIQVMKFIYQDIKQNNRIEADKYHHLVEKLLIKQKCDYVILGCTEFSVAQEREPYISDRVIDAQQVLANTAVSMAKNS
ncbi:aspartate/glutamate racemase family protein [Oenococcus oeni]|uniref:aspartate/glutamate racemase family protein n=1 Tax=Oenococcus oeni TaxID=1247 RepID=UPI000277BC9F|nr:amino acid racemase [Oenococcus oeni]EJO07670.1 aspartate racemase [Oenococcus oeni AWRIB548]KEP85665.1 aspartate racemase [Oenococcus oeni IOEB_0205]KGH67571.1 aspartate racemase [Oenococcus oeni IOEB_B16]OIL80522.1 aspartate racemase [Oenococcus oeni]PDH74765.1 aspartate racemase [Oenococcus oeni]